MQSTPMVQLSHLRKLWRDTVMVYCAEASVFTTFVCAGKLSSCRVCLLPKQSNRQTKPSKDVLLESSRQFCMLLCSVGIFQLHNQNMSHNYLQLSLTRPYRYIFRLRPRSLWPRPRRLGLGLGFGLVMIGLVNIHEEGNVSSHTLHNTHCPYIMGSACCVVCV